MFPGELTVAESPRQPVGWPNLSQTSQSVSPGVLRGDGKQEAVALAHGPPGVGWGPVCRWEGACLLAGCWDGLRVSPA